MFKCSFIQPLRMLSFALLASLLNKRVESANILFLAGVGSPSHHIWNREIAYALAERDHNLTVISPRYDANPPRNVHYLHIVGDYKKFYNNLFKVLSEPVQRPAAWQDVINYHAFCALTSGGKLDGNFISTFANEITNEKF